MGRRYGLRGPWVLRGVDLVLPARGLVRIEGANGTGKSTLLRMLAGIDAPSEGRITGRPRTAYVPERFPAALPFTAAGYLVHLGRIHGLRTAEAASRAEEWLTRFGAAEHARTPLSELSKGTSQKVAVAQALLAEPDLLVLDEAWTGLDTGARDELDRAVGARVLAGATVVFVDHDPRRLAGGVDAAYRLEDRTLAPAELPALPLEQPGPRVRIDATGPAGGVLPSGLRGALAVERAGRDATERVRLTVAAAHSDAALRALLEARPPWHIAGVAPIPLTDRAVTRDRDPAWAAAPGRAPGPAPELAPGRGAATDRAVAVVQVPAPTPAAVVASSPAPRPAGGGATTALTRYQAGLLARSQRWLAPVLLYAAFLGVGVGAGQPLLDSLGYAAAALLPVAAWFVRLCVTQEPPAARTVAAAAAGQPRVHCAALLTALGSALALGVVADGVVLLISRPTSTDRTVDLPILPAACAGLLAAVCCALLGAAVGGLCSRPLLRRHGWSLVATVFGSLLALVAVGSPARYAVTSLVTGSSAGTVPVPVLPLAGAAVIAAAVAAVTSRLTSLRG